MVICCNCGMIQYVLPSHYSSVLILFNFIILSTKQAGVLEEFLPWQVLSAS